MNRMRHWPMAGAIGLSLTLTVLSGCQTWVPSTGMTLPSGHYLQHPPQYFPPSPDFPLERELAYQESVAARVQPRLPQAPLPPAPPGQPPLPGQFGPGQLPPPLPGRGPAPVPGL
ncbi:MAG: hypothetical protein ACK4RK_04650 [Gemmataceae bacterium]